MSTARAVITARASGHLPGMATPRTVAVALCFEDAPRTFMGHPWPVTDAEGACVSVHLPIDDAGIGTLR